MCPYVFRLPEKGDVPDLVDLFANWFMMGLSDSTDSH